MPAERARSSRHGVVLRCDSREEEVAAIDQSAVVRRPAHSPARTGTASATTAVAGSAAGDVRADHQRGHRRTGTDRPDRSGTVIGVAHRRRR